ncbi:hypothetical protein BJV78DRAFT_859491 [Lactifluus subvellereus]|nr:hypothetical protein BJV78DRAFT_859491 [Lactifluus subvellereus]
MRHLISPCVTSWYVTKQRVLDSGVGDSIYRGNVLISRKKRHTEVIIAAVLRALQGPGLVERLSTGRRSYPQSLIPNHPGHVWVQIFVIYPWEWIGPVDCLSTFLGWSSAVLHWSSDSSEISPHRLSSLSVSRSTCNTHQTDVAAARRHPNKGS